jgi:hypothetical protein
LTELPPLPQHQRPRSPKIRGTSSAVGPAPCRLQASPADLPGSQTTLLQMLISTTRTLRCINCIIPKLGTRIISDQRCSPLHPRLLQIASVERPARTQQQGLGGMAGEFPLNHDAGSDAQSWSSRPWRAWRRNVTPQRTSPTLSRTSRVGGTPGTTNRDLVTTSTL